jgi:hypothetical protein
MATNNTMANTSGENLATSNGHTVDTSRLEALAEVASQLPRLPEPATDRLISLTRVAVTILGDSEDNKSESSNGVEAGPANIAKPSKGKKPVCKGLKSECECELCESDIKTTVVTSKMPTKTVALEHPRGRKNMKRKWGSQNGSEEE